MRFLEIFEQKLMQDHKVENFKIRLKKLKTEISELEQSSVASTKPVKLDQTRVGRLSRMDAMQLQEMQQEVSRRRKAQLKMIETAFDRIASGEYGYCIECDEEIGIPRLNIDPSNTRCINCAV